MNIRQTQEEWEKEHLSRYASYSSKSLGRDAPEEECDIRTVYQRDRDRILHCKSFRRLKHKTQVFLSPEGDHYRTRLTHTLEVAQIGRTIARALRLNEDLTEAIALGHDLGHTPFGHAGERVLNGVCPFGFRHFEQSIRVVEFLEKDGNGLNLTKEVRDGILNHGTNGHPATLEGKIIRLSDKIAYINHDIDDAIRGKILCEKDLPEKYTDVLGHSTKERLNTLIHDIIFESQDKPEICMSPKVQSAMTGLRQYMFESVYTNPTAKSEEVKANKMLKEMYAYFMEHFEEIPEDFRRIEAVHNESNERVVCDYLAGMSDQYAVNIFKRIFIPVSWKY
ncbi:MAG: deoxyguanosinetriphosphate triphosphohydrolase [Butyrivibrio sp.]